MSSPKSKLAVTPSAPEEVADSEITSGTVAVFVRNYVVLDGREIVGQKMRTESLDQHEGRRSLHDSIADTKRDYPPCGDGAATRANQIRIEILHTSDGIGPDREVDGTALPPEFADASWTIGARYWSCFVPDDDPPLIA